MALVFDAESWKRFDAAASGKLRARLRADIADGFPELSSADIDAWDARLWADCRALGYRRDAAIFAYYWVSVSQGAPLIEADDYEARHARYKDLYGSGEQYPIDIYDTVALWAPS